MADQPDYNAITWPVQLTSKVHRKNNPLLNPSNPALSAAGKTVLITGATGGIGRAIAEAWRTAGAKAIVITGRNQKRLQEVVEKLEATVQDGTTVHSFGSIDITKEEDVATLWKKAGEAVGRIDVLVNNAGSLTQAMIGKGDPGKWWQDFEVNVKAVHLNVHHFLAQAPDGKGTVISVSTGTLGDMYPDFSSYIPSKLAQTKFMEFLHHEQPGIRTFSLFPGLVATDMPPKQYLEYALDDPMLTGGLSLFLSTERAEWLRGSMVSVNWDYEEMEMHKEEILEKRLTKLAFCDAKFGKGGHPWAT
ncbi:hypothetical protein AA0114_g6495 [Alternaria tenuissima]|uniref:Ketoreductase domain-containing protein n=1 Tax=Alternaria tenuissima TaxID=119927 RepID=A0A4Q4MFN7_9PLEO|nr:hypothetical protein AA0114_g6495 [Alternaria tenuissima]